MKSNGPILLGVAGSPVFHSRSPLMFRSIFREAGIDGSYIRVAVRDAGDAARLIRELDFTGMNITAPFKERITSYLDMISEDSRKTGSVNTIINREGSLSGFNTDQMGVTEPLEMRLGDLGGKRCIVIGAGGAGISAAYGLTAKGAEVTILNKFEDQGIAAASKTGSAFKKLETLGEEIKHADIIINTIPYEADPLDISGIKTGALFFDATYKKSHYSELAPELHFGFIGGEEWLIHQGIHACGHFLGFLPSGTTLASALLAERRSRGIISLTGFMASGKSSVGRDLASKLGMEFADTDSIIEQRESMSISDIFEKYGEERFREIETDILLSFRGRSNLVLSCGGGAVISDANREFLINETDPFWLYTSMDETLKRGSDGTRPLIKNMKTPDELAELFNRRKHLYASLYGTLVISEGEPEKTAELIHEEIRLSL